MRIAWTDERSALLEAFGFERGEAFLRPAQDFRQMLLKHVHAQMLAENPVVPVSGMKHAALSDRLRSPLPLVAFAGRLLMWSAMQWLYASHAASMRL